MSRHCVATLAVLLVGANVALAGRVTTVVPLPRPTTIRVMNQDAIGNVYVAGQSAGTIGLPLPTSDAIVAKLSPDGTEVYWKVFGGSGADYASAMAFGPDGSISVIGLTASRDFPLTPDAAQTHFVSNNQGFTGFFARLDAAGTMRYASYLNTNVTPSPGSAPSFSPSDLTLDSAGSAYITGTGSFISTPDRLPLVADAGWILKLDSSGRTVFGTGFIGGSKIVIDSQGSIYIVGTRDARFAMPVTAGAFQRTVADQSCGGNAFIGIRCGHQFVVKLDPAASRVIYATWLSGSFGSSPSAFAVDDTGDVIVAGSTASKDYPVTAGAYQAASFATLTPRDTASVFGGPPRQIPITGYVTKLNSIGTGLIFSTYLGGSGQEAISSMSVDSSGRIYVGGITSSPDFPGVSVVPDGCRPSYIYPSIFATRLDDDGSSLTQTQLAFGLSASLLPGGARAGSPTILPILGSVAFDGQGKATAQMGGELANLDLFAIPSTLSCVADAANFVPLSSVAPGQLVSLFGEEIGPSIPVQAPLQNFRYLTNTGDVSVTFNGVPAPVLFASSTQVNVQVPYEVAGSVSATMKIRFAGVESTTVFSIVPSQPSVFLYQVAFLPCHGQIRESFQPVVLNGPNTCDRPTPRGTDVFVVLNGLGLAGAVNPTTGSLAFTFPQTPVPATATLSSPNAGFTTVPIQTDIFLGQITSVWTARITIPATLTGSDVQLALTVNGVPVRNSLVIWLRD